LVSEHFVPGISLDGHSLVCFHKSVIPKVASKSIVHMNIQRQQTVVLLIGICLCATCALFPPRRTISPEYYELKNAGEVTRACLLSPEFRHYTVSLNGGLPVTYLVELDSGRLLAHLVLIASLTGIVVLFPRLRNENVAA
jgi:hypothetical protein